MHVLPLPTHTVHVCITIPIAIQATDGELHKALEQFDVVGVTERIPELIAMLALSVNCDGRTWAYTSLKRVLGSPTFADMPLLAQKEILKITSGSGRADSREKPTDFAIWRAAEKIARIREAEAGMSFVKSFESLHQGMVDKSSDRLFGPVALDLRCTPDPDHRKHTWHGFDCVSIFAYA
tara:strand:- start:10267 stop:10806 length:540 start_codon:yes stop_codon:yes gene_type:complete